MSKEEFEKFNNGEVLHNDRIHNAKTTSKGFCFFDLKDYSPNKAIHFLSGIVSFDICAVFEVDKSNLKERYGQYHKNSYALVPCIFPSRFYAREYCTTEYSSKNFKLLRFSEDIWNQWKLLEEQEDLKWIEV